MKRLCAIGICMTLAMAWTTLATPAWAVSGQEFVSNARAYFVRAYAMVMAGDMLAPQCNMLGTWQRETLRRNAKKLKAVMTQRLPFAAVNQAERIASDLISRHSDCGTGATSIVNDSLFAAHGLLFSRAEGTHPDEMPPELQEFLVWAKAEMAQRKPKAKRAPAKVARKKRPKRRSGKKFRRFQASLEAYYLERQCKHLSRKAARAYWKRIKRAHKAAVSAFGARKVSAVQRRAERLAKRKASRCGRKTRAQVMAGVAPSQKKRKGKRLRASLTLNSRSPEAFLGR